MAVVQHPAVGAPAHPRVSVCIANFNGEAMLADCIESVLAQGTDAAIEILVHDDASTDASVAMIRERWPQVHVLSADENVGFCVSNNRMVNIARGDYILLLNNDAALYPDAIRHLLDKAERLARPAILTLPQYDWETGVLVDRGCLLDPFYNPVPNLDETRTDVAYVIGACLWLPKPLWNDLGGFPDWFGSIAEDMYVCCAARLHGMPVRCLAVSGYRHRQGASFGGNRIDNGRLSTRYHRRYLSERNRIAVLVSCTPTWLMWPWLAAHLFILCMEGALLALVKRNWRFWREAYLRAMLDAWRGRHNIQSLRQHAQVERTVGLRRYMESLTWKLRKPALLMRHGLPVVKE